MLERLFPKAPPAGTSDSVPIVEFASDGVSYRVAGANPQNWLERPFAFPGVAELGARLNQLRLDGAGRLEPDRFTVGWDQLYTVLGENPSQNELTGLRLPPVRQLRPTLSSIGSLSELTFRILISGWIDEQGVPLRQPLSIDGAVFRLGDSVGLLPLAIWKIVSELAAFHARAPEQRTRTSNETAWARLRHLAVQARAPMSDYLHHTVVVTPEKLRLDYRRVRIAGDEVVEVVPGFAGEPRGWLEQFDSMPLQTTYSVPAGPMLTQVVLSDAVRDVLSEIKRMPGRRVSGARAEALIANPIAAMGESAAHVLEPGQIEEALQAAELISYRFTPRAERDAHGMLTAVMLVAESANLANAGDAESVRLADVHELDAFCERLAQRLATGSQWCGWGGYDFELLPESTEHLRQLRTWLAEWRNADVWRPEDLFDLSQYSSRVAEIGVEKPYALPFVQRRAVELDWFVENVIYGLVVRPPGSDQASLVKVEPAEIPKFKEAIERARLAGQKDVLLPGGPAPIPIEDAERAIGALDAAKRDVAAGTFAPDAQRNRSTEDAGGAKPERRQLVIKSNIDIIEHAEERTGLLAVPEGTQARLPRGLCATTQLKPHQLLGVAWLQHLWRHSPGACRGALLADDMGLGKTLQLLTLIAEAVEEDAALPPALIIAPVALLENWKAEIGRFFSEGALPILTLYGRTLSELRAPRDQISEELTRHGITKLLRKNWIGSAKVVLTTYETLRDLEFTLAAQPWSIMVCDEAQKIKNPSAMVTRAAKKQNVRFRIACTGTPVENTLLDLWCLFDFIQPGLLGALNQFQRSYKQPIEAKSEEQKAKVRELRLLIEPQTLRRTKQEVARNTLPAKLEDDACRALPMSARQLQQYWRALERLKQERETDPSAVLQTLHHIRRICSDPFWQEPSSALKAPLRDITADSPKLRWLLCTLDDLKARSVGGRGEKAIVFCEFRDLQVLLQRAIKERIDFDAYVVNGETSASLEVENSRQKLIDRFQSAPGFGVIILSPLAVGFGVNIQAANHVIHFTRTWNPAKEDQATDRAYRIGQERDVTVYYPSVVGEGFESFDAVLHKLLTWKRELARDMLNGAGELSAADFEAAAIAPSEGAIDSMRGSLTRWRA